MLLYAATALLDGQPVGAFLLAENPDEAAALAMQRLGENGKLTHIVQFCEARLGTLKRNGLLQYVPTDDQIKFVGATLLDIVKAEYRTLDTLRKTISAIYGILIERLGLRQFAFTAREAGTGIEQLHEIFAPDLETATRQAERQAVQEYGEGAIVISIREVTRDDTTREIS